MNATSEGPVGARRAEVATFDRVTRRFGEVTAVDGLTLVIKRSETVALLGPNGAGKTTATETLLGLIAPDAGEVRMFGGPPGDAIRRGRVGAMLQDAVLPEGVKVVELIELIRGLYRDPLSLEAVLRTCDLTDVAHRRVEQLSGGQRQRVRLALALAGDPELLVLDEPTAALDVAARRAFWERVRDQVAGGRTVLFATHRLEEAEAVADRVVVIARGLLLADGSPGEVKALAAGRSAVSFFADGVAREALERLPGVEAVEEERGRITLQTADADVTVRALLERVPEATDLEITRGGLEDAFLSLTAERGR